ncbi:hypothetical protein BV22DRAFT_609952 [Leucogyrophana mollusca]|uniref:Uncharacterized protein n=1 Tax=Leucogyrophana mollusca TaxID=85980 RepID=A0ACB8BCP8_9AGAM|nr:hypothetical protein BV22DRAFT_609952 [Leucogyrophana mollusca]
MFTFDALLATSMALSAAAQYTATYLPSNAPAQSEQGQAGTNQCGTGYNQTSECQNAYINSVQDFCVWSPPEPGANSLIGNTEGIEVAWCMKSGYGTRLIPDGTIKGAHLVITPDYIQVTGVGNLTNLNIPAGDAGGELDPHGATGEGNPIGGLVFSSAFGQLEQIHEWTNFVSDSEFCFRACRPSANAATMCQHIYDVMGCDWNMPGNYDEGVFENCLGDSAEPMGVYGTSTFYQGEPSTPAAHPIPSSSSCTTYSSISNGAGVLVGGVTSIPATSTASHPASTTVGTPSWSHSRKHRPSTSIVVPPFVTRHTSLIPSTYLLTSTEPSLHSSSSSALSIFSQSSNSISTIASSRSQIRSQCLRFQQGSGASATTKSSGTGTSGGNTSGSSSMLALGWQGFTLTLATLAIGLSIGALVIL